MFTTKELDKFEKFIETTGVEDLYTPNMPELNLPDTLPIEVAKVLTETVKTMSSVKESETRLYADMWPQFVQYIKRILPAFTDITLQDVWRSLYDESPSKTIEFSQHLLKIENDFDGAITQFNKHKNEKECCDKMLQKSAELSDLMEEYYCHYYGNMLHNKHHQLMQDLQQFQEETKETLINFKNETADISYLFNEEAPVTRETSSDKALPIFFTRKIYIFFQQEFGKPKNKYITEFISVIFPADEYDEDSIKGSTRNLQKIIKKNQKV